MRSLVAITALALAITASGVAATDPGVRFKLGPRGTGEIYLCFTGGKEDYFGTTSFPAVLKIGHNYTRGTKAYRTTTTLRFASDSIRFFRRQNFWLEPPLVDTTFMDEDEAGECAKLTLQNPWTISFKDVMQKGTLTLDVRTAGTSIGSARYAYVMRLSRAYQIWHDTDFDEYVNYCINEGQEVRSSGGRLYCWYDGYFEVSIKRTR